MRTDSTARALFDEAVAAGLYSQLTGVLAGFALTAIVVILSTQVTGQGTRGQRRSFTRVVEPLFAAFVGLIAISLSYSIVAADGNTPRTALEHVLVGVGFNASALPLLFAVTTLMEIAFPSISTLPRTLVGRMVPVASSLYLLAGAYDFYGRTHGSAREVLLIGALVSLLVLVSALIPFKHTIREERAIRMATRFSGVSLLIAVGACISAAATSSLADAESPPQQILAVALMISGVINIGGVRTGARNLRDEERSMIASTRHLDNDPAL